MVHREPQPHSRVRAVGRVALLRGHAGFSQARRVRLYDLRLRCRDGRHHRIARYREVVQGPRDGIGDGFGDGIGTSRRGHLHDFLAVLRQAGRPNRCCTLCRLWRGAALHRPHHACGLLLHGQETRRADRRSRGKRRPVQGQRPRTDTLLERLLARVAALRALLFGHLPLPEVCREHASVQPYLH